MVTDHHRIESREFLMDGFIHQFVWGWGSIPGVDHIPLHFFQGISPDCHVLNSGLKFVIATSTNPPNSCQRSSSGFQIMIFSLSMQSIVMNMHIQDTFQLNKKNIPTKESSTSNIILKIMNMQNFPMFQWNLVSLCMANITNPDAKNRLVAMVANQWYLSANLSTKAATALLTDRVTNMLRKCTLSEGCFGVGISLHRHYNPYCFQSVSTYIAYFHVVPGGPNLGRMEGFLNPGISVERTLRPFPTVP